MKKIKISPQIFSQRNQISLFLLFTLAVFPLAKDHLNSREEFLGSRSAESLASDDLGTISVKQQLAAISSDAEANSSQAVHIIRSVADGTSLPGILSSRDKETYQRIYQLQQEDKWAAANKEIANIKNPIILGNVLADRYLNDKYKVSAVEIKNWLERYSDLNEAEQIYQKGLKLDSKAFASYKIDNKKFLKGYGENNGLAARVETTLPASYWGNRTKAEQAWKRFSGLLKQEYLTKAGKLLESQKVQMLLNPYEQDVAKWSLASAYFASNHDREANRLATEAAQRSGPKIPGVYWTAGISGWRMGYIDDATKNFAKLANIKGVSGWEKSAAAYWAYRGYDRLGNSAMANQMLNKAAENQYTFYGLLAKRAINQTASFEWKKQTLSSSDVRYLIGLPQVARALALAEIGLSTAAENELRKYYPVASNDDKNKLLLLSERMKMPGLSVRIAGSIKQEQGVKHDAANYPIPHWKPKDGYMVEPALMFALMRHESGFNPNAKSNAGAVGLMQIMPNTATYIAEKKNISDGEISPDDLLSPELNLTIAQDYVEHLLGRNDVNGNLFFMAAAYNAGPNKLAEWRDQIDYKNDPLLFIESIPARETRNFVEQVVANYWIYCKRLEGESKTMDMVLENNWPVYSGSVKKAESYRNQLQVSLR